jgi:transposase InsO family protein
MYGQDGFADADGCVDISGGDHVVVKRGGTSIGARVDPIGSMEEFLCSALPAPSLLLVADFTYVKLLTGTFAYVAFVIDAFAGTIIGWEAATSKETRFVESAIRQAAALRSRQGTRSTA